MLRQRKGKETKEWSEQYVSGTVQNEKDQTSSRNDVLGPGHWLLLGAFIVSIALTTSYCNHRLPVALDPTDNNDRFSETRALPILQRITALGPRPSGSKTLEEDVTKIIIEELNAIASSTKNTDHSLEIVTNRPSGCFDIPKFDIAGMTICYKNVSNIVARLGARSRSWQDSQISVLMNCHYDSQPMSPGPGNQWLLNSYLEAAERPYCNVFGQEVFQSGFVPSDTDFRVLRDYGRVPGLDIAYIDNGYVYHTEFDQFRLIPAGSLQRAGDNILATLTHLLQSPYLKDAGIVDDRRFVFFDVLGFFSIVYSLEIGEVVNYGVVVLILIKVLINTRKQDEYNPYTPRQLISSLFVHTAATIAALTTTFLLIKITTLFKLVLIWYSQPILAIFMYGIPAFAAAATVHVRCAKCSGTEKITRKLTTRIDCRIPVEQASFDAHLIIFGIFLFALTFMKIATAYLLLIFTLFPLARDVIAGLFSKIIGCRENSSVLFFVHLLTLIPGVTMLSYTIGMMLDVFVPIMGRSKLATNPEITIGAILAVTACILSLMTSSLIYRTAKLSVLLKMVFLSIVLLFLALGTGLLAAPYHYDHSAPTLRRAQFIHMRRRVFDKAGQLEINENGIVILPYDFRGADDFPQVNGDSGFRQFNCTTINKYCELPYLLPHAEVLPPSGLRFKPIDEQLLVLKPTALSLVNKTYVNDNEIQYNLLVTGSDHISLQITAQPPFHIVEWSFSAGETPEYEISAFAFLSCVGPDCGRWEFTVTIKNVNNAPLNSKGSELLIAAVSHYLHGRDARSQALQVLAASVEKNRRESNDWKWAMTLFAWSADILSHVF